MKQELFSWGDDFITQNAMGGNAFFVDGKTFSLGNELSFQDMSGNELSFIKQKVLSWARPAKFAGQASCPAVVHVSLF